MGSVCTSQLSDQKINEFAPKKEQQSSVTTKNQKIKNKKRVPVLSLLKLEKDV